MPNRNLNLSVPEAISEVRTNLNLPFSLEIIIIASWSIWIVRNQKKFRREEPSFQKWKQLFKHEMTMVAHRMKSNLMAPFGIRLDNLGHL